MPPPNFDAFKRQAIGDGASEALTRERQPSTIGDNSTHPFNAKETPCA